MIRHCDCHGGGPMTQLRHGERSEAIQQRVPACNPELSNNLLIISGLGKKMGFLLGCQCPAQPQILAQ